MGTAGIDKRTLADTISKLVTFARKADVLAQEEFGNFGQTYVPLRDPTETLKPHDERIEACSLPPPSIDKNVDFCAATLGDRHLATLDGQSIYYRLMNTEMSIREDATFKNQLEQTLLVYGPKAKAVSITIVWSIVSNALWDLIKTLMHFK